MSEQNFNTYQNNEAGDIDLGKLLRYVLMQSKMIFSITFLSLILGLTFYLTSTKLYKISSLLQVESFNQNSLDPTDTLQMMSPLKPSADLDNLILLYKSRTNIVQLITDLNLNVDINEIEDSETLDIKFFQNNKNDLPYEVSFYILPDNNSLKVFADRGDNLLTEARYGHDIDIFNEFTFRVDSANLQNNRLIEISYINPASLYPAYKNTINVIANTSRNSFIRDEGLIEISFVTDNINKGIDIIEYSNKIFLDQRVLAQTEKSRAAITFIDENLAGLQKIVEQNKEKLKEFLEINKSIDLDLETQVIIDTVKSIDNELYGIEVELANASKIYTANNSVYINLINKKKILSNQKENILSKIKVMPKEQQEYIDLFNQVEITQNLYEELETRRLGFSILEASTMGDIRIVDSAYLDDMVSPRLLSVFISTVAGFMLSLFIAIIRGANFLPITNPAEIMDNGMFQPLLGVIPHEEDIDLVDLNSDISRYKAAMEATIINIRSLQDEEDSGAKIIALTSPTPLNGKSTTSKKLAETLSLLGKKVLLVDADFKRGGLDKDFNVKSISEKTFYSINSNNLNKYQVAENFYLIPRVKGLLNSFHFICSDRYPKTFESLKSQFDYIIFDTAPLLSVADTSVILKLADINLLVTRHEVNKIREIKQTIDMFNQINVTLDGFIYNAFAKPTGYYGYYQLYGNYAYAYYSDKYLNDSYEYKNKV